MNRTGRLVAVGVAGSLAVIAFGVFVAKPGSTYRVAPLFLVPIVWLPFCSGAFCTCTRCTT